MPNPHYSQALAARGAMPGMAMIGMPVGVGYGGVGGGTRGAEQIDDEEEEEDGEEEEEQPRGASKQSCRSSRDAEPNCSKKRASRECSEDERIENLQTQVQKLSEAVGALTNALNKGENGGGVVERPGKNEKPLPRRNVDLQLIPEPQFDDRNADHPVQPLPPTEFRAEGEELRQASFIRPISITRVPAGRWGLERLPSVGP
ncbi:MAG TPA: hypothetical protein PLV92_20620 [Pirellulaceae bacterium]|nr:hypothetical protein [Pirellulaceae bacterium]